MSINLQQLQELVINPALSRLDLYSEVASNLVLGTAIQESGAGKYIHQVGGGPALGIFQMEPRTEGDLWENFIKFRPTISGALKTMLAPGRDRTSQLITNLDYAAAMCRVHYLRARDPLPTDPNDIDALGRYWKKFYNTPLGAGKVEEFIYNWQRAHR